MIIKARIDPREFCHPRELRSAPAEPGRLCHSPVTRNLHECGDHPTVTLPKEPLRAAQAFERALDAAVVALGPEVDLYLQGKRPPIKP